MHLCLCVPKGVSTVSKAGHTLVLHVLALQFLLKILFLFNFTVKTSGAVPGPPVGPF